jgi:hypothetical protein
LLPHLAGFAAVKSTDLEVTMPDRNGFFGKYRFTQLFLLTVAGFILSGAQCTSSNQEVLVSNTGGNSITGFRFDSNGRVVSPPDRKIGGFVASGNITGLNNPLALALDGSENIYSTNLGDNAHGPSITVYNANANGNIAPTRTIPGNVAGLVKPTGIVIRPNPASILVSNWVDPPDPARPSGILEFSLTPGQDTPTGRILGSATTISAPGGVALDAALRVYVSEPRTNRILMFEARPNMDWNRAPSGVISGQPTLLDRPSAMTFDSKGNLYVVNMGNSSITIYAADSAGNIARGNVSPIPTRRISGNATMLNLPTAIAVDKNFRIFVTQGNAFLIFGSSASGNAAPQSIVTDSNLSGTFGIAIR